MVNDPGLGNLKTHDPLTGVSETEREIMARLLHMSPETQKNAQKPTTPKGIAQRRRRQKERGAASAVSHV
jgi:hypothetical protein